MGTTYPSILWQYKMEHVTYPFPHSKSICWHDDSLLDWASGGRRIDLNGVITEALVRYAYKFDSSIQSNCGRYAVIYEKLGTKGLVLAEGKVVREINRSFYHETFFILGSERHLTAKAF